MKLNLISKALVVALSAASLAACDSSDDDGQLAPANLQFSFGLENTKEIANDNNIPMPNDLYFIGKDGSTNNNITIFKCGNDDDNDELPGDVENATKCALEDLNGWSTTAPFTLPMSGDITQLDSATFAESIRIFQDTSELVYDIDFTVRTTEFKHLQILPLKPLKADTQYTLVITDELQSTSGDVVKAPIAFTELLNNEADGPYSLKIQTLIDTLYTNVTDRDADDDIKSQDDILFATEFTTQSIGTGLTKLAKANVGNPNTNSIVSEESPQKYPIKSDIPLCLGEEECVRKFQAKIDSPYYLSNSQNIDINNCSEDENNKDNAKFWFNIDGIDVNNNESYFDSYNYTASSCPSLFSSWEVDVNGVPVQPEESGIPAKKQTLDVQVVLPDGTPPANGWPVVIFSHGITAAKEFGNGGMLVLDNFVQAKLASQGYAVIAIDHPLHNTRAVNLYDEENEGKEIAEINVSQSLRGLFPGHDKADIKNFLKADALLTSRDNLRQSIADLINLRTALANGVTYARKLGNGKTTESFDTTNVYVMGHSMGAIAASSFTGILESTSGTANDLSLNGAILANPGAGIAGILMNSVWLGHSEVPPAIKALPEFRLRVAEELGLESDLDVVRQYAEQNTSDYKKKSDQISPEYFSEFQYLMQTVVDTVDPLNYAEVMQDKPLLSFSVTGSITKQPALQDIQGNFFTTADQTVPIKVELDGQTTYEVCNQASAVGDVASQNMGCFNGSSKKPYYSLDNTEFPLSGAEPLETQLGLRNVLNSTDRSYTRFLTGTHNIGAGTLTGSETEGNADYASVDSAATELTIQAASFVKYSLNGGEYVQGDNRVLPEDLTIIETKK